MLENMKRGCPQRREAAQQPGTQSKTHAATQEYPQSHNPGKMSSQRRRYSAATAQTNNTTNTRNLHRHNHVARRTPDGCSINTIWMRSRPTAWLCVHTLCCGIAAVRLFQLTVDQRARSIEWPLGDLVIPIHSIHKLKTVTVVEGSPTLRAASLTRCTIALHVHARSTSHPPRK